MTIEPNRSRMRIGLVAFHHESNTFAPVPATLDKWRHAGILEGEEIRAEHSAARSSVAGFLAYGEQDPDVDVVPLVFSKLVPMGPITAEAYAYLTERMLKALQREGPWDAVVLPLHGAAVSAEVPDADGEFVRRVRQVVGPRVPIGVTLDMHANLSTTMVETADVITVYQTNPHVDAYEQALAAAGLICRQARGPIRPMMGLRCPPLAIEILRQGTDDEPMAGLLRIAKKAKSRAGVLSASVVEGFPYADVAHMGMSFLVITDGDPVLAQKVAGELADAAWQRRGEFVGGGLRIDEALERANAAQAGPVVMLDVGDNVGGGSPGDSTHILHGARRLGVTGVVQLLCDPEVARLGESVGVGARIETVVGGKTDGLHGKPLPVTATVTAITDGRFDDPSPTHGGQRFYDMGLTVGLHTEDGFDLIITTRPEGTRSQAQLRLVGLEPHQARIIVAKGVHSPRVAFEDIATDMIWLATPGVTSADLTTFTYRHRRVPMFPYEHDALPTS